MSQVDTSLSAQIHAAFGWWREAGVDLDFTDDATDWLAQQAAPAPVTDRRPVAGMAQPADQTPAPCKVDLLGRDPPGDLVSFREWWLSEPALDPVGLRGRIAPQGQAEAELMVVVMAPEEGDGQTLLSGTQGRLLGGFLRAAGIERDRIYLASALPRHAPAVDGNALETAGYGAVLRHHIALAMPERVLVFGKNILPLLGHELTQEPAFMQIVHHENQVLPLLVVEGLDSMQSMPVLKARFWRKWLDWTDG